MGRIWDECLVCQVSNPQPAVSNPQHLYQGVHGTCLEDHPRTCKWLVTMVIVSPLNVVIPLTNGFSMAYKWGLLTTY